MAEKPLRSWQVSLYENKWTRTEDDLVTSGSSYRKIRIVYVVARSKKDAIYQAKFMCGYDHEESLSGKSVRSCVPILDL